uniref:CCHC-type domain-containing protein n=1 Tax=Tanacetum cinerariifolium TaxID=118510 RepID=A0A699GSV7_TANCI|nr:hypothetical protein [Tanacetum cinerariifolium]
MMKDSDIGIQEKKAKLFNEWEMFTFTDGESIESYYHHFSRLMHDFKRNKHFTEKIASNLKFLNNLQPEWSRHVTIVHQIKDLHAADYTQLYDFLKYNQNEVDDLTAERLAKTQDSLALMENYNSPFNYPSKPTNNNQRISSNPRKGKIAQLGMNLGQDNQMQIVGGNQFRQYAGKNVKNQNENGNVVAARAEGNANGNNGNQIRCYNCKGLGHLARNCIVSPWRRDVAYLQTQLLVAQKEEAGIQLQTEEFNLMAAAADLDEIKEVDANCILMANLQQASTSGTQTDKAPVYDSDGSANVQLYDSLWCGTRGGTVEQHPAIVEETRAYFESLYNNLAIEVEKVNTVNRKLRETNDDLTTALARLSPKPCSFYHTEQKMALGYQNPFYLKQAQQKQQSLYNGKVLLEKHDPPAVYDSEETLELAQESHLKMKQLNKEIKPANYTNINHLSGKLENENVELEFQVQNYEKENAHLKTAYKNLFDSINVTRAQTKMIIDSLQNKLHDTIYENANLRDQLFDKVSEPKDTTKVVYAMCKQCLITVNHDVNVQNYVNNMNSRGKKQNANVSNIVNQKKHKLYVRKSKKLGSKERLDSPTSSKPRYCVRWSPTGKMFDIKGNLIASSESNGDNACTSNPQEPTIKRFPNSTSSLSRVYFVKGLGHNLFSVGQFCDSDLESWLWHQRLSHFNFNTINDLARNDLFTGLLKFKYHKEQLCASCEQGKSKSASHPLKPVLNSKQRLDLLHMDLCGPMRIASINGKRVYNRRTNKIMETMNVTFDELSAMDFKQSSSKPKLQSMTSGQITMYDDSLGGQPSAITRIIPAAQAPQDVDELETQQKNVQHQPATIVDNVPNAMFDENTFVNPFATSSTSAAESSSSQYVDLSIMHTFYQPYPHEYQWTKDHPLEQVIREPSRLVLTRNQLRSNGNMYRYALTVSTIEPKNVKEAMTDPAWIESMQEALLQFK